MKNYLSNPDAKRKYNEKLFSVVAPKYNFVTRALSFGLDLSWKRYLVDNIPSSNRCLDIACGSGDITWLLSKKCESVVGIDLTLEMLKRAKKKDNIEFFQQDMCNLKFDDESFDVVTGGYALRNAPDLEVALKEVYRTLKPNGIASFLDFFKFKNKLLQSIQLFLLTIWGGFWGLVLHLDPSVYTYIPRSLKMYPDTCELKKIMKKIGFKTIKSKKFLGFVEVIQCRK